METVATRVPVLEQLLGQARLMAVPADLEVVHFLIYSLDEHG